MRDYSIQLLKTIYALKRFDCDSTGKRTGEIATYLGVHRRTVWEWWRQYQLLGETADGQVLYKIGITTRSIDSRLVEIYRDLTSHYQKVEIEVINVLEHRGNVERYFKYRYCDFNYPIGSLTEYFNFADKTQVVEHDLHQMPAKVLSPVEQAIIDGKTDEFLAALLADNQIVEGEVQVSDRLRADLQQNFLSKPASQRIIAALHQGDCLRDAAAMASVSVEVARKVVAVMQKY